MGKILIKPDNMSWVEWMCELMCGTSENEDEEETEEEDDETVLRDE